MVVLARLAVCRTVQGRGIARALLADAFERVLQASTQIGVRGIVVHAASAEARSFYLQCGCHLAVLICAAQGAFGERGISLSR